MKESDKSKLEFVAAMAMQGLIIAEAKELDAKNYLPSHEGLEENYDQWIAGRAVQIAKALFKNLEKENQ